MQSHQRLPVIGTRGSPLALWQAHEAQRLLARALCVDAARIAIVVIKTTGDTIQDRPLSEAGGKGLFTKELDEAMLAGRIDLAVHSAKDLPTHPPRNIAIGGYLAREDVRDAFISARATSIAALPQGAVVGSASLRRQAQIRRLRPDLKTVLLRGNVETRLRKVETGEVDASLLALAGMKRLGLAHHATAILETKDFLPAVGQGAIAITVRDDDAGAHAMVAAIADATTGQALAAERAFLAVLDGSCRTPIAGHATVADGRLDFDGLVLTPDGAQCFAAHGSGQAADAAAIGAAAGHDIRAHAPAEALVFGA